MKFTFWAVGAPLLLMILDFILQGAPHRGGRVDGLGLFAAAWLLGGTACTFWYWIVRLVRRAWRDGSTPVSAAAPSDRIFGRLS